MVGFGSQEKIGADRLSISRVQCEALKSSVKWLLGGVHIARVFVGPFGIHQDASPITHSTEVGNGHIRWPSPVATACYRRGAQRTSWRPAIADVTWHKPHEIQAHTLMLDTPPGKEPTPSNYTRIIHESQRRRNRSPSSFRGSFAYMDTWMKALCIMLCILAQYPFQDVYQNVIRQCQELTDRCMRGAAYPARS
ncbi:hypothetical protein MPH_07712 [Macrophomina phaseolina MS6]|uniref:Uncharacterized protein n=1 Tax=Macrophomina phaseolina (strain MS6) TaxID=1126212 RepID=K2SE34_MACPH|nr:hypothetical protein MPH_07712 [Macrophomina phaseolina MS6]